MRVPRVEEHRRHHMSSMAFVLATRKRVCLPRNFFIRFTHNSAVTGWARAGKRRA